MRKLKLISAALFLISPFAANADPIKWTLTGVTFNDGGTASGSFFYNADTDTLGAINIATTATNVFDGATYNATRPSPAYNGDDFSVFIAAIAADLQGIEALQFIYTSNLTDLGGLVLLDTSSSAVEGTCIGANCPAIATARRITGGGVVAEVREDTASGGGDPDPDPGNGGGDTVAVPEPGTLALLGLGLAGMGLARRRKKA